MSAESDVKSVCFSNGIPYIFVAPRGRFLSPGGWPARGVWAESELINVCFSNGIPYNLFVPMGRILRFWRPDGADPAESLSSEMLAFPMEFLTICLSKGIAF